MTTAIQLSVALVTRNRPESLQRCLASLRAQDSQPFEVVVSDDSDPSSAPATREIARRFGCRYVPGPRRGLYANRNAAALQCVGTHVRTMDDDHTFPSGHFSLCQAALQRDPCAIWTTGETCYIDGQLYVQTATALQLHPSGVGTPVSDPDDNWAIADGSTIYPREIFTRGLRMVEAFGFGSSYLEFGAYLYRRGYRSRCLPGAKVEHHADLNTVRRSSHEACLYASLCYTLYFKPSPALAVKHIAGYLVKHQPSLIFKLPALLKLAHARWAKLR